MNGAIIAYSASGCSDQRLRHEGEHQPQRDGEQRGRADQHADAHQLGAQHGFGQRWRRIGPGEPFVRSAARNDGGRRRAQEICVGHGDGSSS